MKSSIHSIIIDYKEFVVRYCWIARANWLKKQQFAVFFFNLHANNAGRTEPVGQWNILFRHMLHQQQHNYIFMHFLVSIAIEEIRGNTRRMQNIQIRRDKEKRKTGFMQLASVFFSHCLFVSISSRPRCTQVKGAKKYFT